MRVVRLEDVFFVSRQASDGSLWDSCVIMGEVGHFESKYLLPLFVVCVAALPPNAPWQNIGQSDEGREVHSRLRQAFVLLVSHSNAI